MKKIAQLGFVFLIALGSLFSVASAAAPSWWGAYGKLKPVGHQYFSAVEGDFVVNYYNEGLPWGTQVLLQYGFTQSEFENGELVEKEDWVGSQKVALVAISPYKWGTQIIKQLYSRGSSTQFTRINLVLEIRDPNGNITYERGSFENGFLSAATPKPNEGCNPWGETYCTLQIKSKKPRATR
jgi:hypothetical protein